MTRMPDKDFLLVQQFRMPASRKQAFEAMVARYNKVLFQHIHRFIRQREEVEDLLQTVWIKVWKGLDNFRGECLLSTWLFTIATREVYSKFREKRVVKTSDMDVHANGAIGTSDLPAAEVIMERLQEAIDILPDKQRRVFIMRYFEEMSYEEMAAATGTSIGALKASYHHAVKKIEQNLNPD